MSNDARARGVVAALVDARAESWSLVVSSTMLGVRAGGVALVVVVLCCGRRCHCPGLGVVVAVVNTGVEGSSGLHHLKGWGWPPPPTLVTGGCHWTAATAPPSSSSSSEQGETTVLGRQGSGGRVMGPVVYDTGRSVVIVHHVVKYTEGCRCRRLVVTVTVVVGGAGGRPVIIVSLWHLPWSSSAR